MAAKSGDITDIIGIFVIHTHAIIFIMEKKTLNVVDLVPCYYIHYNLIRYVLKVKNPGILKMKSIFNMGMKFYVLMKMTL